MGPSQSHSRTNGGPGCSSLKGMFHENGVSSHKPSSIRFVTPDTPQPFTWRPGQALPTQNEWSWTNLSSVLYVEQPVGTGFSQGTPNAKVRILSHFFFVSPQFVVYYTHGHDRMRMTLRLNWSASCSNSFLEIFSELKGKKFYLTGESVSTDLA